MGSAKTWSLIVLATLVLMGVYFLSNPSYQRSVQAKYHYMTGDYKEAYALASEAFELDRYNRMAATIMTQSQISIQFVEYIEQSKSYLAKIAKMAEGSVISDPDKAKIKMMCEVMMESFVKISPIKRDGRALFIDEELLEKARAYDRQFSDLHAKISAAI